MIAGGTAYADLSCRLVNSPDYLVSQSESELVIREGDFHTEALLITDWGTKTFRCGDPIMDAYECYGFAQKPGEAPTQLNVIGSEIKPGSVVVFSALNLVFVSDFLQSDFSRTNLDMRRFSTDVYVVSECE